MENAHNCKNWDMCLICGCCDSEVMPLRGCKLYERDSQTTLWDFDGVVEFHDVEASGKIVDRTGELFNFKQDVEIYKEVSTDKGLTLTERKAALVFLEKKFSERHRKDINLTQFLLGKAYKDDTECYMAYIQNIVCRHRNTTEDENTCLDCGRRR